MGAATARLLSSKGLTIALVGRRAEALEEVAGELSGTAVVVPADLASTEAPVEIVERVLAATGRIDVIVNNAAAFELKQFEDFSLDDFDRHVAVNVRAPYFLVQAALPALRASPAPVVVNVSSVAAAMYRPRQTVYGLSKAALEHLTLNLAAELAPDRIRVNCIRPGPAATPLHARAVDDPEARLRELGSLVPLGRVGEPGEIARWIWHLVDRDAEWVTGAVLTIDGGRILGPPAGS